MSTATNKTFDVDEFNRNVQQSIALRNLNNSMSVNNNDNLIKEKPNEEKPKEDYTGFNHADFVSWAKSSTDKPFNQPQITANKQQRAIRADTQQRPDNEWFDYDAFVSWAKSHRVLKH
jgi:hypothetical protein